MTAGIAQTALAGLALSRRFSQLVVHNTNSNPLSQCFFKLTPACSHTAFPCTAITGCKPGQCADPLICIIGVKSKCGCPAFYDGRSQVLLEPAGSASYCSPVCAAKIKGSALVCGENTNSQGSSAYCRSSATQKTASCVCPTGFEFTLNPALQTDPLTGTKYYTGTCVCSKAGFYPLPSPYGGP
eukprot:3493-Heterococcus_DN1.PRE.1